MLKKYTAYADIQKQWQEDNSELVTRHDFTLASVANAYQADQFY